MGPSVMLVLLVESHFVLFCAVRQRSGYVLGAFRGVKSFLENDIC